MPPILYCTMSKQLTIPKSDRHYIDSRHRKELFSKRGLNQQWCEVNCRSLTATQATELLGYKAHSDGIWLEGANFQGQFKPDKPWKSQDDKKSPKYRSPLGEYDVMLPIHPENPHFWDDIEALKLKCYIIDGHPCLVTTEGFFKAIALCSHEVPTIALQGVEMGLTASAADPQGKRYLVPTLEKFARAGLGFIHAFDADAITNPNVIEAQRKLVHQLKKFNVPQYNVTGLWTKEEGKGIDDYIQMNGADKFKQEVLAKAVSIDQWEKQFQKEEDDAKTQKKLPPRRAAQKIAERYRTDWKYHLEQNTWRNWNGRIWEQTHEKVFTQAVYQELEAMPQVEYDRFSYVDNVIQFLELERLVKEWKMFDRSQWIPFRNGVYEVEKRKLHDHSPGFGFTSYLDHDFPELELGDESTLELLQKHAPTFYNWAMHAQKQDPLKVQKLLAIINGVIKYRFHDLQLLVHLCGVPGSGKGTFARILESVVGRPNHTSARLHKLGDDYTIASLINHQLVICPDERKHVGDWGGLLALTGKDSISYREIYRPQSNSKFYGTIVVISNAPVFAGDTTGIDRRLSLVTFDVPLPFRDPMVEAQMQQEVPALIAIALSMNDTQVTDLLKGTGDATIPDFKRQQWLHKTENDSVALFMEEFLAPATEGFVAIGNKHSDAHTLYGAYVKFCEENNSKTLFTANNFRNRLLELARELNWDVREARQRDNQYRIYGIRLRETEDTALRISEMLGKCVEVCNPCVNGVYTPEPLENKECVECVDKNLYSSPEAIDSNIELLLDEQIPSDETSNNSTHTHTPCTETVSSSTQENTQLAIAVGRYADYGGEKVEIVGWKDNGKQVWVELSSGKQILVKRGNLKPWVD
ncbi:MAG: DUF3854 domain-containing protein [Scytonema sp. PMC 1070.18]|nr:DUF3854 domain-containing protein [Scytonema sp. PMC 1070.18]